MSAPTGILTSYDENRILYKKEIINNIEIFVYSNNSKMICMMLISLMLEIIKGLYTD